jgi:biotin-dependent carboxylase-like uncharacterized protein
MTARSIAIERPGLQTIVVDAGRFGLRHQGIAWCGPMDARAYVQANHLLGNDREAAALEVVLGDLAFTCSSPTRCAIAGADCGASVDDRIVDTWSSFIVPAGGRLRLHRPAAGMRTIVAFDGGIDVPIVLGSRTTDVMARFGGYLGRALRAGDTLDLGAAAPDAFARATPPSWDSSVRIMLGPHFDELCARPWRIGHESNRMAWRLRGEPIAYRAAAIASRAVFPGMVQMPPSGEPIVLAADAQTTGGYPIAGTIVDDDLWKLAQAPLGTSVQFIPV